jgi:hypothetical protein
MNFNNVLIALILFILSFNSFAISIKESPSFTIPTETNVESVKIDHRPICTPESKNIDCILLYELKKSQVDYEKFTYEHNQKAFSWQLAASKVIFWTVIITVLAGVFSSIYQLYMTFKIDNNNKETKETEVELSVREGIKIKSSIIGLTLLVLSLAFFYLYLIYIEPIRVIGEQKPVDISKQISTEGK